jgi:hypothetical protein
MVDIYQISYESRKSAEMSLDAADTSGLRHDFWVS